MPSIYNHNRGLIACHHQSPTHETGTGIKRERVRASREDGALSSKAHLSTSVPARVFTGRERESRTKRSGGGAVALCQGPGAARCQPSSYSWVICANRGAVTAVSCTAGRGTAGACLMLRRDCQYVSFFDQFISAFYSDSFHG